MQKSKSKIAINYIIPIINQVDIIGHEIILHPKVMKKGLSPEKTYLSETDLSIEGIKELNLISAIDGILSDDFKTF